MTEFEKFKNMSIDEMAEWLDEYGAFDGSPWMKWWNDTYCQNCPAVQAKYVDTGRMMDFSWCELEHKCKFFPDMDHEPSGSEIVKLWLQVERAVDQTGIL